MINKIKILFILITFLLLFSIPNTYSYLLDDTIYLDIKSNEYSQKELDKIKKLLYLSFTEIELNKSIKIKRATYKYRITITKNKVVFLNLKTSKINTKTIKSKNEAINYIYQYIAINTEKMDKHTAENKKIINENDSIDELNKKPPKEIKKDYGFEFGFFFGINKSSVLDNYDTITEGDELMYGMQFGLSLMNRITEIENIINFYIGFELLYFQKGHRPGHDTRFSYYTLPLLFKISFKEIIYISFGVYLATLTNFCIDDMTEDDKKYYEKTDYGTVFRIGINFYTSSFIKIPLEIGLDYGINNIFVSGMAMKENNLSIYTQVGFIIY